MKLTKYKHACFTIEIDNQVLVVDPGVFTSDFELTNNIVAIVATHEHPDHFSSDLITKIYTKNPGSILVSLAEVVEKMLDGHKSQTAKAGDKVSVGPFKLEFFGGEHAHIYPGMSAGTNLGVLINDLLYYPGDSLTTPNKPVDTLALPVSAPWLKTSEAIDFLTAIKPHFAFPTHDAFLSNDGQASADGWMQMFAEHIGTEYKRINGQTIDLVKVG